MPRTKSPKKMIPINVKIPEEMYNLMLKHVAKDTHSSLSELVRDALRDWLEKRQ
jgi:Arc/MetJ-type ribon-helix-helix transcriptional regulator